MGVPDFQSLMLPLLKLASDKKDHTISETVDTLGRQLGLSEEEKKERVPSGRQSRFDNRVQWALTYLRKAGLLEAKGRARFGITSRGLHELGSNPARIDIRFLTQFPEFMQFRTHRQAARQDEKERERDRTPEEELQASYEELRSELADQLLKHVTSCSPRFFEDLVVDLLVAMGYGGSREDAGEALGQYSDGGVDGIIKEDRLGLDAVYIQAKRWGETVGRPVVQGFAGSLEGFKARKGVLITTSQFSREAQEYVSKIEKRIVLIDGAQLVNLMIDYGIGVTAVVQYVAKRVDLDYFGVGE